MRLGWMRARSGRRLAALGFVVALLGTAACGQGGGAAVERNAARPPEPGAAPAGEAPASAPAPTPEPERVIVGISSKSLAFLPFYVGVEKGMYRDQGLAVEITPTKASTILAAMLSGEMHFAASAGSAIRAAAEGAPIRMVAYNVSHPLFGFYVHNEIEGPEDLKGKVLAVNDQTGTNGRFGALAVEKLGLDPKTDIQIVSTGSTANNLAAMASGQAQASVLSPPFGGEAVQLGFKLLLGADEVMPGRPFTGIAATEERIQSQPDLVKRMIRGTLEAVAWMREQRAETVRYMAKEFEIEERVADATYDELIQSYLTDGRAPEEGVRLVIAEEAEKDLPVSAVQDMHLLEEVLREMGGR